MSSLLRISVKMSVVAPLAICRERMKMCVMVTVQEQVNKELLQPSLVR